MIRTLVKYAAGLMVLVVPASVFAGPPEGVYNTGPSIQAETAGASLNIRFGVCSDRPEEICATVLDVIEPDGPSGKTNLPSGDPIIGYVFVRALEDKEDGKYRRGKILSIDESMAAGAMKWYGFRLDDNFDGTLTATGCLGFICPREMIWRRIDQDAVAATP